ncbi:hypothetical protein LguiB_002351 [Lonicera macranthoides]
MMKPQKSVAYVCWKVEIQVGVGIGTQNPNPQAFIKLGPNSILFAGIEKETPILIVSSIVDSFADY